MVEIARILCPVDFSDNSQLALDYALSLAAQHSAAVSNKGAPKRSSLSYRSRA